MTTRGMALSSDFNLRTMGITACFQSLATFSGDISNTPTQVVRIRVASALPRVLCKRNRAEDDLVHGFIAKAGFFKEKHIPVDACEDVPKFRGIDQNDSAWGLLVAFPEQSFLFSLAIVEGSRLELPVWVVKKV